MSKLAESAVVCLAVCLLCVHVAVAQEAQELLQQASVAFGEVDFERSSALALSAIEAGGLPQAELVHAYELFATSRASLGDDAAAERAYRVLISLRPDALPSELLSPERRGAYTAARVYWELHPGDRLSLRVRFIAAEGALRIELTDPLASVAAVDLAVFAGSEPLESRRVSVQDNRVDIPLIAAGSSLSCSVRLLDGHGNTLLEAGTRAAPLVVLLPVLPPAEAIRGAPVSNHLPVLPSAPHAERRPLVRSPWLWAGVASSVVLGVLTSVLLVGSDDAATVRSDLRVLR